MLLFLCGWKFEWGKRASKTSIKVGVSEWKRNLPFSEDIPKVTTAIKTTAKTAQKGATLTSPIICCFLYHFITILFYNFLIIIALLEISHKLGIFSTISAKIKPWQNVMDCHCFVTIFNVKEFSIAPCAAGSHFDARTYSCPASRWPSVRLVESCLWVSHAHTSSLIIRSFRWMLAF